MIKIYSEKIDNEKYYELLEFLFRKCDIVSFAIPNYGTVFDFNSSKTILDEYNKIKFQLERDNQQYKEYYKNIDTLLKKIDTQLINKCVDIQYFDQVYNYEHETRIYNYNSDVFEVLKKAGGLYKWRYPNFPEDLYFFSNGKCYFKSISHEKESWIFDNREEIIDFVENLELDYYIISDSETILLDEQSVDS